MNEMLIQRFTRRLKSIACLLIITAPLTLMGCSGGDSSSQACSTTTTADSSGNPITTVTCDNG